LAVVAEIDDSGPVSVYENFILFEANDFDEAEAKTTARGKLEEAAGDDMRVDVIRQRCTSLVSER